MFIRKKKNSSGVVSVQVIDKSGGKYRVVKTVGSSSDAAEIEKLYQQGKTWLADYHGERDMFAEHTREEEEKQITTHLLANIENILLNGTQLILNRVFHLIGFDRIDDEILKHLVVSRICQPRSKVATLEEIISHARNYGFEKYCAIERIINSHFQRGSYIPVFV
jgi:hypothetical protein